MRRSSLFYLMLAGFMLVPCIAVSRRLTNDAELTCNLESQQLSLHEPIAMSFTISNHGAAALKVDFGWNRQAAIGISIVKPDGNYITATHPIL